jgi:putative transposase
LFGNLLFLGRGYLHRWTPGPATAKLLEHMRGVRVTTIDALLESPDWRSDDVYGSIAQGLIYADLKSVRLGGLAPVNVYASEAIATLLAVPPGTDPVVPTPSLVGQKVAAPDLSKYSPKALAIAWERFAAIKPVVIGVLRPRDLVQVARGWWRAFKRAAAKWGAGILGLIPDFYKRGHHGSHLSESQEAVLQACIEKTVDPKANPEDKGFGAYLKASKNVGNVSRKTFFQRLAAHKVKLEVIAAEKGDKAAYQATPAAPLSISAVSRMARRAWQLGIIDHTPLPIRCRLTISGKRIDLSPWLTYMKDAGTHSARGMYLAWHRPRKESVIATLWDCLKRYGRLTDSLLLDGEKGHDSIVVEQFLARHEVDKICRRYLTPRDGHEIEGGFSLLMRALLMYIKGNYVANQDPRKRPEHWDPADFAERTVGSLHMLISRFLFGYFNKSVRLKDLGDLTPDEADDLSSRIHGERGFMLHPDLKQSRILLLPSVSRGGLRKLDRQHGLRLFGQDYLPPHAIDPVLYDKEYPVLSDPTDVRYVLAHVGGQWLEFQNRHKEEYEGLDPEMLAGISVEIVQTSRWHESQADERSELHADELDRILALPKDPLKVLHESIGKVPELPPPPQASGVWSEGDDSDIPALPVSTDMAA